MQWPGWNEGFTTTAPLILIALRGQPISVDYRLTSKSGNWKVFDVAIENVSLVTNYRSSFAAEIAKGGTDNLIRSLEAKNRSGENRQAGEKAGRS